MHALEVKVAQLCPTLRPHGLYSPWDSSGQNTGVGSLSLLLEIFPTQGSKPGLPHFRWILYQLNHKGSSRILAWVACPFSMGSPNPGIEPWAPALQADPLPTEPPGKPCSSSLLQGIFPTRRSNPGLLHCRQILYQLSHQGSPILLTSCDVEKLYDVCMWSLSHVRLWDPMDCSPPGFSVHGVLQARIQEWVAISRCV